MTQEINYKVNAWLTTKGTFLDQMKAGGAAADTFSSKWSAAGAKFSSVGRSISGSTGAMLGGLAKFGAAGAGVGLAGGFAAATKTGIGYNQMVEDAALTTATMFTAFKMGAQDVKVLSGETSQFAANLERANAMQAEIYDIAKRSPGTYRDINLQYTMMAAGLSSATQDLERQKKIIEQSAVLAGIVEGDFKQLGSDIGRIVQGLAGMDVRTFAALQTPFGEAMAEVTQKQIPQDMTKAFNALSAEDRLKVLETVLKRIPAEVGERYSQSFGGMVAATESALEQMAGNFSKPLFESMKTALGRISGEGGILGGGTAAKLNEISDMLGHRLAGAFERGMSALERGVKFIADNWEELWLKAKQAGVIAATAIKVALVAGVTRMVAGNIIAGIGAAMRGAGAAKAIAAPIASWIARQSSATGMAIGRGMKGKGRGMLGGIGAIAGELGSGLPATRKAIASGFAGTRRAFSVMTQFARDIPSLVTLGFILTGIGFETMIAKAKGLPALVRRGMGQFKLAIVTLATGAGGLPSRIAAGFTATKTAFAQMVAGARAMGIRGMAARGKAGLAALGGRAAGGLRGAGAGLLSLFGKGTQGAMLKLATAGAMLVALAGPALILGTVLGGVLVAFGGLAAYISTKWKEISSTLVEGLEQGTITLVPLMTSLYTFWMRLVMVGEAIFGSTDATSTFSGVLNGATYLIDLASTGLGYMIKGLSLLVGAFGAVQLGISGVIGAVAWLTEQINRLPGLGPNKAERLTGRTREGGVATSTAEGLRKAQAGWMTSAQDTVTSSEKLARAADRIFSAQLSGEQQSKAEERAKLMTDRLKSFLAGDAKSNKPKGAKVNVGKVEMNIQLDEPDPDRVMALLVKPLMKMAQGRTQAYSATESGA